MPVPRTLAFPSMPSAVSDTTAHLFGALAGLADRGGGRALAAAGRLAGTLVRSLATPLAPDDYLGLIDPLLSARHPAGRVVAVRPECAGAATLEIRPGRGWAGHRAGQYLPVGLEIDGVRHWRTYSITSPPSRTGAPGGRTLTITVKEDPGGRVSPHLVHRTLPDTVLRLGPAQGEFTLPEDSLPPQMLMLTAGSGITPVAGMLRTLAHRRFPGPAPDVVLLHSAPGPDEFLFRAELAGLAARLPWLSVHARYTRTAGRLVPGHMSVLPGLVRPRDLGLRSGRAARRTGAALGGGRGGRTAAGGAFSAGAPIVGGRRRDSGWPGPVRAQRHRSRRVRVRAAAGDRGSGRCGHAVRVPPGDLLRLPRPAGPRPRPRSADRRTAR